MLANKTSFSVLLHASESPVATKVASGATVALPEGLKEFYLTTRYNRSPFQILSSQEGVVYLKPSNLAITRSTEHEHSVYTITDNVRHVLHVQNQTKDLCFTFYGDDQECVIVPPRSFLIVTGKTTVRTCFGASLRYVDTPTDTVIMANATLTFTPLPGDPHASDLVIHYQ